MRSNNSSTERDVLLSALASDFQVFFERVFADVEPRVKLVDSEFIAAHGRPSEAGIEWFIATPGLNLPPRHLTHQSIIKTTFLLYKTAGRATAVG